VKHRRKLLLIDEKPSLLDISKIAFSEIDEFSLEVKSMALEIDSIEEVQVVLGRLKKIVTELTSENQIIDAFDPNYFFDFRSVWNKKYNGTKPELLNNIEGLIQNGGRVSWDSKDIFVSKIIKYDLTNFNTVILDGTSNIDMDYRLAKKILKMPFIRNYQNLHIHVAQETLSKAKFKMSPEYKELLVNSIKDIALGEKVLVLCYKEQEIYLRNHLSNDIKKKRVFINHYGNVKGSNKYCDCTAIILAGVQHKGDPYYFSKYEVLYDRKKDLHPKGTISGVRRYPIETERVKTNDQLVG
jgi:hypothetical protein